MYRPLTRFPLRSIAESYSHLHGRRIGSERLYNSHSLTRSTGQDVLWNRGVSSALELQWQIVKALRLGERGKASKLLSSLGQGNDLTGANFVQILKFCVKSSDPLFVMETLKIMDEKEISLNSFCSVLMVKTLCNEGYLEEAFKVTNYLVQNHAIYSTLLVYNTILGACVNMQNTVYIDQCLELMEQQKVGKNEITYTQLLKLAVWQQNLPVARELWKDYIKHYSLSIIPLKKFIFSFSSLGDLKSACKTLQYMVALVIRGKTSVNESIEGKYYSSRGETESSLVNIHTRIPDRVRLGHSFRDLIYTCAKFGNGGLAEQLFQQMQKFGFEITSSVCDGLIRAIVLERGFSCGMEILKNMQQIKLKPYARTLGFISINCSKALELGLAETLLDQISTHSCPHPFNVYLAACDITDQPEKAVRMLAKMKHLQVKPNISTYQQLFSLFGSVNAPYEEGNMLSQVEAAKRIVAIERHMASYGIQHSVMSMNNLLKVLGAEGMTRPLIHYLQVAEDLFCRRNMYPGTIIYNTVLHSLVENEESQMAIKLFKYMKSCGYLADCATYTIMIQLCKVLKCYRSACALVSMMLRDGFYPQTVTYIVLIKTLLEDGSIDEALNLLDLASSEGNKLDVLIFNIILQKARDKKLIDVVEFLVGWMHQEKIRPDSATCSYVFTAYTRCGFYSTATEALQVLSMRMICDEDGSFPEKTKFEDDYIFAEDEGVEPRIIKHFKDFEENFAVALLNLRWCAMLGFSISWLPDQSPWAKRLATNYKAKIEAT